MENIMRLDKFFSSQSIASRKEIKDFVKKQLVSVNGVVVKKSDVKINIQTDEVRLNGEKIDYQKYVYIMMNKPKDVICSTEDKNEKTVIDILPEKLKRANLFPAGRLDKDTTGFVLITDDGELAHSVLSPKHHVNKTYLATIDNVVTADDINAFQNGITLKDGFTCLPAKISQIQKIDGGSIVEVIICEGKYHQIKRMFASRNMHVVELKRVKIGEMPLDKNLGLGESKGILYKDIQKYLLGVKK